MMHLFVIRFFTKLLAEFSGPFLQIFGNTWKKILADCKYCISKREKDKGKDQQAANYLPPHPVRVKIT